jgi:hypothetical protein
MQNNETPTIDITLLNDKTTEFWYMIKAKIGIVMLQGRGNVDKSATCKFIADNVCYNGKPLKFIDLRLSQMDETNFCFPKFFNEAMREPVLINFEELNRCSQDVQNIALEILNERTLHGNKLPDHVFIIATWNIGDEEGCAVQQFYNASILKNLVLI